MSARKFNEPITECSVIHCKSSQSELKELEFAVTQENGSLAAKDELEH